MYFEKNHGISAYTNIVVPVLCGNLLGQASVPTLQVATHQRHCGSGFKHQLALAIAFIHVEDMEMSPRIYLIVI